MHPTDTLPCFASHMGLYAIQPQWLTEAVWAVQQGLWTSPATRLTLHDAGQAMAEAAFQAFTTRQAAVPVERKQGALYSHVGDIALIRLIGSMTKVPSKFGGTSTLLTQRAIRDALADEDIRGLLLAVESPGGQVPGTLELAEEVRQATYRKPVAAYYEDLAASAALWATMYAQRITANQVAEVGSIGVFARLIDLSGAAEREGVKVEVISTGPYKGLGVPGTAVTPELRSEVQKMVDGIGVHFFAAVQTGRRLTNAQLAAVTTGQTWLPGEAQALGLIDGVETFEEALSALGRLRPRRRMAAQRDELAQARAAWETDDDSRCAEAEND